MEARGKEPLDDLIAAWREADGSGRQRAIERIAAEARDIARRAARAHRLGDADADEVGNEAADKFRSLLEGGQLPRSSAVGLVWRMGSNAALSLHRKHQAGGRTAQRLREAGSHEADLVADSAEVALLVRQRRDSVAAIVREQLDHAPANYRRIIQLLYLEEREAEDVTELYLEEDLAAGSVEVADPVELAQARTRARNRVDQHHGRALKWLRARLETVILEDDR